MKKRMNIETKTIVFALLFFTGTIVAEASEPTVIGNPRNNSKINDEILRSMLIGKMKFWESGSEVVIAVLKSDQNATETLSHYSGMTPSKFKNHWQRIAYSGRGKMPKMFNNIEDLIAFVSENEGAIGIALSSDAKSDLRKIN